MNSNYAVARLLSSSSVEAPPPSESFARLLRSGVAQDSHLETPSDEPALSREAPEPPAAPTRSRSTQTEALPDEPERRSSVPHYLSVAESLQYPRGPYRQAPAEHGGEWWLTNPFTGEEPWRTQGLGDPYAVPEGEPSGAGADFLAVFGPKPNRETHPNRMLRSAAVADWERNQEHFKGVGVPAGFTQEQVDAASTVFESWGMGRPLFYEGRYGWMAKFPAAEGGAFEASPFAAIEVPHLIVARYQVALAEQGSEPSARHPFVPPQVFEEGLLNT